MQQRYYDPGIGRFLSVDSVTPDGNTGAKFNRYVYARNNPYAFTDPDGRDDSPFSIARSVERNRTLETTDPAAAAKAQGQAAMMIGGFTAVAAAPFVGMAALANPATANAIAIGVAEVGAGEALGGAALGRV